MTSNQDHSYTCLAATPACALQAEMLKAATCTHLTAFLFLRCLSKA